MKWILTGCDITKDVTVSDMLQLSAIDIQLKDADRLFRLYIKSLGDKAVYRMEHRHLEKNPNEHDLGLYDCTMNI